jgi:SAM-dependent methyltransferase
MTQGNDIQKSAADAHHEALGSRLSGTEITLGPWASDDLINDPKRLSFVLARYKFVSKILEGKNTVLEIGCGDGFGLPVVAASVGHLYATDWDPRPLENTRRRLGHISNVTYLEHDHTSSPAAVAADAAYSVDVIEHIEPTMETVFLENIAKILPNNGVLLTGTPNLTAAEYASPQSKAGHINLKSHDGLRELVSQYFDNVFMFGMNDEVVHTGYGPMCHYIWALGVGVRQR